MKTDATRIAVRRRGDQAVTKAILSGLNRYNAAQTRVRDFRPVQVAARTSRGRIVGGLEGYVGYGWLFIRFLFWMTLNWALAILSYYIIILAFFPQTQVTWAMFGLGAAAFGNAIPALPGGVGTLEGAFGGALTLLTKDEATSFAAALTARFYNYINSGVIGGIGLLREGETLSGIYKQLTNLRNKEIQ